MRIWYPLCALVLLLAAGCSTQRPDQGRYYHVVAGDTLYSIAWRYGLDFHDIARWNSIEPPYVIYPGQRLSVRPGRSGGDGGRVVDKSIEVPEVIVQRHGRITAGAPEPAEAPPRAAAAPPQAPPRTAAAPPPKPVAAPVVVARPAVIPDPKPAPRPATPAPPAKPANPAPKPPPPKPPAVENRAPERHVANIRWRWPTAGRVSGAFSPSNGRKGVDITGKLGQAVVAAAAGTVVYSGRGLIGYGNLVIIKHDDVYLSAYGHNRRLLVKEGDRVAAGQKIAEMGQTSKSGSILHFEIRRNGQPVNPIKYLPAS